MGVALAFVHTPEVGVRDVASGETHVQVELVFAFDLVLSSEAQAFLTGVTGFIVLV